MSAQIRCRNNAFRLIGLFLSLATSTAFAKTTATNTLTFTESLTEKVACTQNKTTKAWSCGITAGDNYTISATVLLAGVNPATFTGATTFDLKLGNLQITHPLSFDPKYTTGKSSATFVSSYTASNKKVGTQTVILKWTASQLTISINGKTTDTTAPGWDSIWADAYAGNDSGTITDATTGSVSIGAKSITFNPTPVAGTVVTKAMKGKDNVTYKTSTVKIKGTAFGSGAAVVIPGIQVTIGGTTATTNMMIGSQGGTNSFSSGPLSGVRLVVPVGALPSNIQFSVSASTATATPHSGTFSGRAVDLHVAGTPTNGITAFSQPVAITIPFTNNGTTVPVPYYIDANGRLHACQVTGINRQAGTLTFETWHASLYTWILTHVGAVEEAHTTYVASIDGFQVNNGVYSTPYNRGGNCFGMCAFEQWYFSEKGGGLYPKYMQNLPVPGYAPLKGQDCIATRAMNSVIQIKQHYDVWPDETSPLSASERVAVIANIIANTETPTMLWIKDEGHIVLATDVLTDGVTNNILINDPNSPGQTINMYYVSGSSNLVYRDLYGGVYTNVLVQGAGSWQLESFDLIYRDAESGFSGSGAAQVNVTSHTNLQQVTDRTINLSGVVSNGQVAVGLLDVINNGTKYRGKVDTYGNFNIPISIVAGTNQLTFVTHGYVNSWVNGQNVDGSVQVLNTQKQPFNLLYMQTSAVVLVTLTWNTTATDLDLYTIDPTGDYSSYYHNTTASGGTLDHDVTGGYGPEHWTLSGINTVQWGQGYKVRIHYYSDHQACSSCDPVVPVRPTGWTVSVVVYEGTPRMETFYFSGVLDAANSGNARPPTAGGSDWTDVCTITPVKEPGQLRRAATAQRTSSGEIQITVPVPSEEECLQLKLASPDNPR